MEIRKATANETNAILSHALDVMKEATMGKVKPLKEKAEQIMLPVLAEGGYYLVYVENKTVRGWVGVGQINDLYSKEIIGLIPELYVMPPYRKRGIARKLCEKACDKLRSKGCDKVQLNVFEGNQAKVLYQSMGFYNIMTMMEMKL